MAITVDAFLLIRVIEAISGFPYHLASTSCKWLQRWKDNQTNGSLRVVSALSATHIWGGNVGQNALVSGRVSREHGGAPCARLKMMAFPQPFNLIAPTKAKRRIVCARALSSSAPIFEFNAMRKSAFRRPCQVEQLNGFIAGICKTYLKL